MVLAQLQPRLVGGRAAAGDMTDVDNARLEVEKGLRLRLAPQGITGVSYLEMDYVDPPPPVLPISWTPINVYIPSAPSTVTAFVNAAQEILNRLQSLDVDGTVANLNRLLTTANDRIASIDTKGLSEQHQPDAGQAGDDARRPADEKDDGRSHGAAGGAAPVQRRAAQDARQSRRCRSCRTMRPPPSPA